MMNVSGEAQTASAVIHPRPCAACLALTHPLPSLLSVGSAPLFPCVSRLLPSLETMHLRSRAGMRMYASRALTWRSSQAGNNAPDATRALDWLTRRGVHSDQQSQSSSSGNAPSSNASGSWARHFRLPRVSAFAIPSLRLPLPPLPALPPLYTLVSPLARVASAASATVSESLADDVPTITCMDTPINRALVAGTPALTSPFRPTFWMRSAHAQTIFGTLLRFRPPIVYQRDILTLASDGGTLAVDWDSGRNAPRGQQIVVEAHRGASPSNPSLRTEPILFLLPGLTGGSASKYLCQTIEAARARGWRSCVMNFRGICIPMSTPRPSTGINVEDVREALEHVHRCYPRAPIVALGFSMGANMLVKTLGQLGPSAREYGLVASAAVSCAFDFVKLARALDRPLNQLLYSRFLTMQLKRNYIRSPGVQSVARQVKTLSIPHALAARTIWELDERFTRHMYGIDSTEAYYDQQSCKYLVSRVATPLLCLNAEDDPFEGEIPLGDIRANPSIILATTKRGGHVAWTSGVNPLARNSSWMISTTLQYLQTALQVVPVAQPTQQTQQATEQMTAAAEARAAAM